MKLIRILTAVIMTVGMSATVQAGLFSFGGKCGAEKSCGCAPTCQPRCCKPTIMRPCESKTFTFQRVISKLTPPCCKPDCCAPKKVTCCAPAAKDCAPACAPKGADCAAPNAAKCAPKCGSKDENCTKAGCGPKACCGDDCCSDDACEIAELIYTSQTACYAKHRARAIDRLGDRYNCRCNPEIMCAFVYALNDCDERVRHEAADEIGDQVRRNGCCCMTDKVVEALTHALADCDRGVRHEAEEALEACGYEVVDCCKPACGSGCGPKCGAECKPAGPACDPACSAPESAPAAPAPMPEGGDAAPAPAPPEEKSALKPLKLRSRLAGLFGLR